MRRDRRPLGDRREFAHALLWMLCILACAFASPIRAQSRAWLDRDRIEFGESTTLYIEVDTTQASGIPDISALDRDFDIVGRSMQQNLNLSNGDVALRVTLQLILQPRRSGTIEIPILRIGSAVTPPLRLTVLPPRESQRAAATQPDAQGAPLFIEASVDDDSPYVQQTLGYTIRLYYRSDILADGRIDQDPPEGASLQRIGDDLRLSERVGGDRYTVIERHFLLIPERSGAIAIPPARFQGRAVDLFESMFDPRQERRVRSAETALRVKPIPPAAPQPWLPLRGLTLRYLEAPRSLRVGEAAAVTVEAVADGATAAQLPSLTLSAGDGAQVFAEPAQTREDFVGGRPRVTVTRRFSLLPSREGSLRIVGPRLDWWDTEAGIARIASLPDLALPVAPGAANAIASSAGSADETQADRGSDLWSKRTAWHWVAMPILALLWVGALVLGLRIWSARKRRPSTGQQTSRTGRTAPPLPGGPPTMPVPSATSSPAVPQTPPPSTSTDTKALAMALARGELAGIANALCAMVSAKAGDLDAVRARLDDPAQRDAVDGLERARWGDGDAAAALHSLRHAFASGPRWRRAEAGPHGPRLLPPLYPQA